MLFQRTPVCVQRKSLRKDFNIGNLNNYLQEFYNFCICLSLLSTNFVCPVNSNPVSSYTKVSNRAFAENLSNPCTLTEGSSLDGVNSQESTILQQGMKRQIPELKKIVEDILKARDLSTCASFISDQEIPLAQNFLNNTTVEAVRLFYTSLLNHTAYVFFVSEEVQKCLIRCSWDATLNDTQTLAPKMQKLMCFFRSFAVTLTTSSTDSLGDAHKQIFNEEFADTCSCSRSIINACLALQDVLKVLTELLSYLRTIRSS